MEIIKFYNRESELGLLEKVKKPFFCILYGRRRIGKTTLALQFLKDRDYLYFFVNPKKPEALLLQEYTVSLREKLNLPDYVRPNTWDEFFKLLFENYNGFVVFDEFQWFLEINKEVPFALQKHWDLNKSCSVILTGSVTGMIKKLFAEHGSPLFKRADVKIELKEFDFKTVLQMLKDSGVKDFEEQFRFYLLFGGTPYYYRLIQKYRVKTVEDAIKSLVISENAPLKKEVEEVMAEAFKRDYRTYLSILYAIAEGKTKLGEIAGNAGIKATSIMPYLYDLMNLMDLVEKQRLGFKKKHVYLIKDRFHGFWLRYMHKYAGTLGENAFYEKITTDLNSFFGWSFEATAKELAAMHFSDKFTQYMKYIGYSRKAGKREPFDIDLMALNEKTKEILFCECKWKEKVNAEKVLAQLKEKAQFVEWHNGKRKESYAIFAKSFSKKAQGAHCFELKDLEKAFKK